MPAVTVITTQAPAKAAIAVAPATKECLATKLVTMSNVRRDILMLLKNEFMNEKALEHEIETLNELLRQVESPQQFCITHELVNRNRITSKAKKLIGAIRFAELKPFHFLVCKN